MSQGHRQFGSLDDDIDDEEHPLLCVAKRITKYSARRQHARSSIVAACSKEQKQAGHPLAAARSKEFSAFDTYIVLLVGTQAKTTQFLLVIRRRKETQEESLPAKSLVESRNVCVQWRTIRGSPVNNPQQQVPNLWIGQVLVLVDGMQEQLKFVLFSLVDEGIRRCYAFVPLTFAMHPVRAMVHRQRSDREARTSLRKK